MLTDFETFLLAVFFGVSVVLFATSVVLAILHYYGVIPCVRNNQHDNRPAINHVLPQQPPPVHFYPPVQLNQRVSMVDDYPCFVGRRDEEDIPRQVEVSVQEGSHGSTSGTRLPIISSDSSSHHESASHTPHPERTHATAADLARYLVRLRLGNSSPQGSPAPERSSIDRTRGKRIPNISTGPNDIFIDSTSELDVVWDNLNLPYTAFFPHWGNPYRASEANWEPSEQYRTETPDPNYPTIHWDEPVQVTELPPTPPRATRDSLPKFESRRSPTRQATLAVPRRKREPPGGLVDEQGLNQDDRDRRRVEAERAAFFRRIDE